MAVADIISTGGKDEYKTSTLSGQVTNLEVKSVYENKGFKLKGSFKNVPAEQRGFAVKFIIAYKKDSLPQTPYDGKSFFVTNTNSDIINFEKAIEGKDKDHIFVRIFPQNADGMYQTAIGSNTANTVLTTYRIMTVIIDQGNSNPATCCTYADDAIGMTAGSDEWDDFFGEYPCLFKNGKEVGKLKKDNFDQFENGIPADISSGNAGDVMTCFPRRGLKISTSGNKVTVSMTDNPDSSDFDYFAHTRGSERRENFYLGTYKGSLIGNKLRSLKGHAPNKIDRMNTARNNAHANGAGYELSAFYQLTFRQAMYVLKYKDLNSKKKIGIGAHKKYGTINTGGTEQKGLTWGTASESSHIKLFGIEDFWGNIGEWLDGINTDKDVSDKNINIFAATTNFNDNGTGYNIVATVPESFGGYMSEAFGTATSGLLVKSANGSENTYFCDYDNIQGNSIAIFAPGSQGVFGNTISCHRSYQVPYASPSGRLMYL